MTCVSDLWEQSAKSDKKNHSLVYVSEGTGGSVGDCLSNDGSKGRIPCRAVAAMAMNLQILSVDRCGGGSGDRGGSGIGSEGSSASSCKDAEM